MVVDRVLLQDDVPESMGRAVRRLWAHRAVRAVLIAALFAVLARQYCGRYFPLDPNQVGGPGEFEPYTAVTWLPVMTLAKYGEIPLWSSYWYNGQPFIGNAYFGLFDPLLLAILGVLGPINGPKIAATVAAALMGLGQYWLSRLHGQGRVVAVVAGVVGMTCGALVARIATGFAFAFAWSLPWVALTLASFILALRTRRPATVALAALCYAELFYSGTLLYFIAASGLLVLYTVGYALELGRDPSRPPLGIDRGVVTAAGAVAGLVVLMTAAQSLPIMDLRNRVSKPTDVTFSGTQAPLATLFNFVVPDPRFWQNRVLGAHELGWPVHYSYVGAGLFLFLLFLLPAFRRRPGRDLVLLAIAFGWMVAWASARHTFMWEIWQRWEGLRVIRFQALIAGVATVVLIPLALAGADYLWKRLEEARAELDRWGPALVWRAPPQAWPDGQSAASAGGSEFAPAWSVGLLRPALYGVLALLLWGVARDPWLVNRGLWNVRPYDRHNDEAFAWLKEQDPTAFTLQVTDNFVNGFASIGLIRYEMRVHNSTWLLQYGLRGTPGAPENGLFVSAPKYIVTHKNAPAPGNAPLVKELALSTIYQAPPGLPFAFVADPQRLPYGQAAGATAVASGLVTEVVGRPDGPNRFVVQVPTTAPAGQTTLVLMQTAAPGWSVRRPGGARQAAQAAGGFLAIDGVRPGETYVFSYLPLPFVAGAALSVLGVLGVIALLAYEVRRLAALRLAERLRHAVPGRRALLPQH